MLFCVAIGAFATSQIVFIKELGIGTAVGVILGFSEGGPQAGVLVGAFD